VFGADAILWVEGQTEELCFPVIAERVGGVRLGGVKIVGVVHTGDFEGRYGATFFDIYARLSGGPSVLPPAVGFIFDREGRTPDQQADLEKRSKGQLAFLPRRMFENYLIVPTAIAAVVNGLEGFSDRPLGAEDVERWLDGAGVDWRSEAELRDLHGAGTLDRLFKELSEQRHTYDKVTHGLALTEWLVEHRPEALRQVGALVRGILEAPKGQR
jgi:hypothetical protein